MHPQPLSTSSRHGAALLRVSLGVMWIAHALLKLLVFTLPGTAQFFASVGFPGWMAYPVFAAELLGGAALLFGVYARQVSLLLVPVMAAAAWATSAQWLGSHQPRGWLGIPGVPHRRIGGAVACWRRIVCFAPKSSFHFCLRRQGHGKPHAD